MRQFATPKGRRWTVTQLETAPSGGLLHFASTDGLNFELAEWPREWESLSDDSLADLLSRAVILTFQRSAARTAASY